jgi:microcystin-dependent protein
MAQMLDLDVIRDTTGAAVSGAKRTFFTSGTTNPLTVYSDVGLTAAESQPVLTDASGGMIDLFVADGVAVKTVVTDADDVSMPEYDKAYTPTVATSGSTASGVTFTPTSTNAGTNVQSAIGIAGTKVGVSANDSTEDHLIEKLTAGTGVTLTEQNDGSDETLQIGIDSSEIPGTEALPIVGEIRQLAGTTIPDRWNECDGSAVSRTTYSDLFAAIGIVWGTGDGSTTFNVPDLRDYFLRGRDGSNAVGTVEADQIGNHVHNLAVPTDAGSDDVIATTTGDASGATTEYPTGNPTSGAGSETRPKNKRVVFVIYTGVSTA